LFLEEAIGTTYNSSYLTQAFGSSVSPVQHSYALWDAAITLGGASGKWDVSLIGRNLTNVYIVNMTEAAAVGGMYQGRPMSTPGWILTDTIGHISDPRTVLLQASYHF
jgi:hypothetical protein